MKSYSFDVTATSKDGSSSSESFVEKVRGNKGPLIGTVLTIASVTLAQIVAQVDSDFVMIDMEHAPLPMDVVTQMVQGYICMSQAKRSVIIRIPSHGVEWVKWALDSGAAGIIIPMVNNAGEMKALLDHALYPPAGRRSFGPVYASFADPEGPQGAMSRYFERAKRGDIAILPMIESREGLEKVEEIVGLDGVSGCFIGPADLRLSLRMTVASDGAEPEFQSAMAKICSTCKRLRKVVGTMGLGADDAGKRAAEGIDFLLSTIDSGAILSGMASELTTVRNAVQREVTRLEASQDAIQ